MSQPRTDREPLLQWLQPGAIVPVDTETVRILLDALRSRLAQLEHKPMHPTLQKMWEGYFDKCYKREWVGLTDEEIHRTTVVMGFNPEWTTEIGVAHAIVRNLEAKLKERNT